MKRRGVILARQSKTREKSESLAGQVEIGRDAAARFEVEVVAEFVEPPSTSGTKDRGRNRHHFRQLVDMIASGQADCVIVYKTDRLTRGGGIGWAPLIDAAEHAKIDLDRLVLTPAGWMSEFEIGIRATMDREEAKKLSDRSRDLHERLARDGKPTGHGFRPFGFEPDGITHRLAEVELIREAAARKRAGQSWYSIATDWMERGIVSSTGKPFKPENLARIVRSPRIAGLRTHHGKITAAAWLPILDAEMISDLGRPAATTRPWGRVYLLSGFVLCGKPRADGTICGAKLRGARRPGKSSAYLCSPPISGGCSSLTVQSPGLEEEVLQRLLAVVSAPTLAAARAERRTGQAEDDVLAEVQALEGKLEELAALWAGGTLETGEWVAARQGVEQRLGAARRRLVRRVADEQVDRWAGHSGELDAWWRAETTTLSQRRAVLAGWIDTITVGPSTLRHGTPAFDPDRVKVRWRI